MSGGEYQERAREELHQSHHAKSKCAAGQRINLPTDSDGADLIREFRKSARAHKEHKGTVRREPHSRAVYLQSSSNTSTRAPRSAGSEPASRRISAFAAANMDTRDVS